MVSMIMYITAYQICLPTGERLDISSNVIIESSRCFSPRDLSNLSLIYCSNVDSFWYGICSSWLSMHKEKYKCMPEFETFVKCLLRGYSNHDCEFSLFKTTTPRSIRDIGDIFWVIEQLDTLELTNPNLKKGGKKKNAKAYGNQNASPSPKQSSRPHMGCYMGIRG